MNFFFLDKGNKKFGSNRIYIENLSSWVIELGHNVKTSNSIEAGFDFYILSKNSTNRDILNIKEISPNSKCGLVHPSDLGFLGKQMIKNVDFLIVGSIEEKDYYLNYHKNIFRFPQIEKIESKSKIHIDKKIINIGYHGNLEHLEEMEGACKNALERISKEHNICLKAIYDKSLGHWSRGRPNIPIEDLNWTSIENVEKILEDVDIGISPGTNNFFLDKKNLKNNFISNFIRGITGGKNKRTNDYIIRFKATSNAGRCFVFHQLGIPVIGDFWPSNFEILANPNYGLLAHSEQGWYECLKKLVISKSQRQILSDNALNLFQERYHPLDWTAKLVDEIASL